MLLLSAIAVAFAAAQPTVIHLPVNSTLEEVQIALEGVCTGLTEGTIPNATLLFAPGTHRIDMHNRTGHATSLFDVTGCAPRVGSRLVIAGAGMDATTLVLATHGATVLIGHGGWARLTVRDLTFARPSATTTQAMIVDVAADGKHLTLQTAAGFPAIGALLVDRLPRLQAEQGLYLRRYTAAAVQGAPPQLITDLGTNGTQWPPPQNDQVHFLCGGDGETCPDIQPTGGTPGQVRLAVSWGAGGAAEQRRYASAVGDARTVVGVKVKHGGQSFALFDGDDLAFVRVRWTDHSRGIASNTPNVLLRDTRVEHSNAHGLPAFGALATPGGGPQINGAVHNVTIVNHTSAGTGDDSLGLFGILSGSVTGCDIRDSFARGILLANVSDAFAANVKGNTVVRCPIFRSTPPSTT
jgi:hypothetical protein